MLKVANGQEVKVVGLVEPNTLVHGDCLEVMKYIADGSVDMVMADPPYETTACKWDSVIPLGPMWKQLKRVIKSNGAIVITAVQPFTTKLVASNMEMFRYEWVWCKHKGTNVLNADRMPLRAHENVLVFYSELPVYNPQMTRGKPYRCKQGKQSEAFGLRSGKEIVTESDGERYPLTVQGFSSVGGVNLHFTQKPVPLMEYMIRTYTNEGDVVLDFVMGSGTTGVACKNLNRAFIGIELDVKYFEIARRRISSSTSPLFVS